MNREQVPDELVLAGLAEYWNDGREHLADYDGDDIKFLQECLAAVLPVHERQVREQVAKEIEDTVCAPPKGHDRKCPDCYRYQQMKRDARIARGES